MAKRNEFIERISKLFGRNSGKKYEEVSGAKRTEVPDEQQGFNSNNEENSLRAEVLEEEDLSYAELRRREAENELAKAREIFATGDDDKILQYLVNSYDRLSCEERTYIFVNCPDICSYASKMPSWAWGVGYLSSNTSYLEIKREDLYRSIKKQLAYDDRSNSRFSLAFLRAFVEEISSASDDEFIADIVEVCQDSALKDHLDIMEAIKNYYAYSRGKEKCKTAEELAEFYEFCADVIDSVNINTRALADTIHCDNIDEIRRFLTTEELVGPVYEKNEGMFNLFIGGCRKQLEIRGQERSAFENLGYIVSSSKFEYNAEQLYEILDFLRSAEQETPQLLEDDELMLNLAQHIMIPEDYITSDAVKKESDDSAVRHAIELFKSDNYLDITTFLYEIKDSELRGRIAIEAGNLQDEENKRVVLDQGKLLLNEIVDYEVTDENREATLSALKAYLSIGVAESYGGTGVKEKYIKEQKITSDEELLKTISEMCAVNVKNKAEERSMAFDTGNFAEVITNYITARLNGEVPKSLDEVLLEVSSPIGALGLELNRVLPLIEKVFSNEADPELKDLGKYVTGYVERNFIDTDRERELYYYMADKYNVYTPGISKSAQVERFFAFYNDIRFKSRIEKRMPIIAEMIQDISGIQASDCNDILSDIRPFFASYKLRHDAGEIEDYSCVLPIMKVAVEKGCPVAAAFTQNGAFANQVRQNELEQLKFTNEEVLEQVRKTKKISALVSDEELLESTTQEEINSAKSALENEKLTNIIDYYLLFGVVTPEVTNQVIEIAKKTNPNITKQHLINALENNPNVKGVLEKIQFANTRKTPEVYAGLGYPPEVTCEREKYLHDLQQIFPKTRFQGLPHQAVVFNLTPEQRKNYDIKVAKSLVEHPIFSNGNDGLLAIGHVVNVMGLLESDEKAEQRRQEFFKLLEEAGTRVVDAHVASVFFNTIGGLSNENFDEPEVGIATLFDKKSCTMYRQRTGVVVPKEFESLLGNSGALTPEYMAWIKKFDGVFGKKINDFISPYAKTGNGYRLKRNVQIPLDLLDEIKPELTIEEYSKIIQDGGKAAEFVNPFKEMEVEYHELKKDVPKELREKIRKIILRNDGFGLQGDLSTSAMHRMFDGKLIGFDQEFYDMFMRDLPFILGGNEEIQSKVMLARKKFGDAKTYYSARGNDNVKFSDVLEYLDECPFAYEYGNQELAKEAKRAGVNDQQRFDEYQHLEKQLRERKLSTIPRHEKTYKFKDKNGVEHEVMTKILRLDDPMNMFVGESKFSNCCQCYGFAGEECMIHASTSKDGGIFAIYEIVDGQPKMVTQSWIWQRETKLCLDNIEATQFGKDNYSYAGDMVAFAIRQASKDIAETSEAEIEKHIARETRRINSLDISDVEKKEKIKALEEIRNRQVVRRITIGTRYGDLGVEENFTDAESVQNSKGPKGYDGYRDSEVQGEYSLQRVVYADGGSTLPEREDYEDVPIYRDARRVEIYSGHNISQSVLKRITDIELSAHKPEMQMYTANESPVLQNVSNLANINDANIEDLRVVMGEDWYLIYGDGENQIEVFDFAKTSPRLKDENSNQQIEMSTALMELLKSSIKIKDGKVVARKTISADLREDTSYLLYLHQKRRGLIEQIGEDEEYSFIDSEERRIVSEKEQQELLEQHRKIMTDENPETKMHSVQFVASQKFIKKVLGPSGDKESIDEQE